MQTRLENLMWVLVILAIFAVIGTDPLTWDWIIAWWMEVYYE